MFTVMSFSLILLSEKDITVNMYTVMSFSLNSIREAFSYVVLNSGLKAPFLTAA